MFNTTPIYSRDGIIVHRKVFKYMLDNPDCDIQWSDNGTDWHTTLTPTFDPYNKYRIKPKQTQVKYIVFEILDGNEKLYDHAVLRESEIEAVCKEWKSYGCIMVKVAEYTKTETEVINP